MTQEVISVALRLPLLLMCCRSVAAQEIVRYYYKNQHVPSPTHIFSLGVSRYYFITVTAAAITCDHAARVLTN